MTEFKYAEIMVEGKKLKDWLMSDEGLVDYDQCQFRHNVSNTEGILVYDLGEYVFDSRVGQTTYRNGVDLARVAAVAMYGEPYHDMSFITAMNGDDYVRIFKQGFIDATIDDFVLYFFHVLDGDVYISKTNHHVFLKGRSYSEEEWKEAVEELYSRKRGRT